jgi:hypothetical protein
MHYSRYPARTDACVERSAKEKRLDTLLMSCYSIACYEKRHIVAMLKENRREKPGLTSSRLCSILFCTETVRLIQRRDARRERLAPNENATGEDNPLSPGRSNRKADRLVFYRHAPAVGTFTTEP